MPSPLRFLRNRHIHARQFIQFGTILMDTLINTFVYSTISGGSYVQQFKPRYVLGFEYFVTPRTYFQVVGGTGFGLNGDKSFLTVNAHQELWELVDLSVGLTRFDFQNPTHTLTVGASLNMVPFQPWFNVNTSGIIASPGDVRYVSVRLDFNLNIGWCKDRDNDGVKDRKDSCYKFSSILNARLVSSISLLPIPNFLAILRQFEISRLNCFKIFTALSLFN